MADRAIAAFAAGVAARDRVAVARAAAALIASGAAIGDHWGAVARAMRADGEVALAIAASANWLAAAPGERARWFGHAELLARYGRLDEAAAVVRAGALGEGGAGAEADDPGMCHFLGTIAMQQNRLAEAAALFRRAVARVPMLGRSWHALIQLNDMADGTGGGGAGDDARALMAAGPAVARAGALDRAAWHAAVGQVLAARGDHAAAYRGFAEAAAIMAVLRPYDAAADAAQADRIVATWDAARIAALSVAAAAGARPIVVAGPPRSGTTLVARIVTAHAQVGGGDETNLFTATAHPLDVTDGDAVAAMPGAGRAALALRYRRVLAERSGAAPVLVDKTLSAGRCLGTLAALLPDAALIWVRRDARDAGWSAFRTFFPDGVAWSWSPAAVMRHLAIEARLLAHWQAVLGPRLLTVDHAALVRDPAAMTAVMLRHCGLPDDPACLRPERSGGAVTTASTLQVRRPVSPDAVGASTPYARFWAADGG